MIYITISIVICIEGPNFIIHFSNFNTTLSLYDFRQSHSSTLLVHFIVFQTSSLLVLWQAVDPLNQPTGRILMIKS